MNAMAINGVLPQAGSGKTFTFKGKGLFSTEIISVNGHYLTYKKRSSVFAPLLTISIPRINIKHINYSKTLTGAILKITTLSNNNILTGNFSRANVAKIRNLLITST
jgi:hypothetical protein